MNSLDEFPEERELSEDVNSMDEQSQNVYHLKELESSCMLNPISMGPSRD